MRHEFKPTDKVGIKKSKINGDGLFANDDLNDNVIIGKSHIYFNGTLERTGLSYWLNHSDNPNALIWPNADNDEFYLVTDGPIKTGEEITVNYRESPCCVDDGRDALTFKNCNTE